VSGPAVAAALALFPSIEHLEFGLGPYAHGVAPTSLDTTAANLYRVDGLDLLFREVSWVDGAEDMILGGWSGRVRAWVSPSGPVRLDQLLLDSPGVSVRVRPELGDDLALGFLGGSWESTITAGDVGWAQYRLLAPGNLTLLGFSNTDQDDDEKLKYYISIGAGGGADAIAKVVGPLGLGLRAVGAARTMNRHRGDDENLVRHDVRAEAELGPSLLFAQSAWSLRGWAELHTQWEPRDERGRDGVDRQYGAAGVRLSARFYRADERVLELPF